MSTTGITPEQANFVAFGIEGILYGINIVIFVLSLSVLLWNRKGRSITPLMLASTSILFTFCTVHFWLEFENLYRGLMVENFDVAIEDNDLRAADTLFSITDFFGQLVLIYRCWLVWERNFLAIVVPLLMSFAAIACAMAGVGIVAKIAPNSTTPPPSIIPLGDVAFALPLGVNFLLTALIVGRIWHITRGVAPWRNRNKIRIAMEVIVESGALILIIQLIFVILWGVQSNAQNIVVSSALQIYGIAPTLIIVRVGMGQSIEETVVEKTGTHDFSTQAPTALVSLGGRSNQTRETDVELGTYDVKRPSL